MDPSRDRPTVCLLPSGSEAEAASSPSSSFSSSHSQSSSTRSRTPSVTSSLSWSQQQPLLHIHLMFLLVITASIWTYCMSRSDFLSFTSHFRIPPHPTAHLLSHLYQQSQQSHMRSNANSGAVAALADPSSGMSDASPSSLLNGPASPSAAGLQHKNSFSWSSSPYPSGNDCSNFTMLQSSCFLMS